MSLKTVDGSKVNVVSKKITEYLSSRQLKRDEIVKYRLLTGVKNTDKDKTDGEVLYPSSVSIPLTEQIIDDNGLVTIGAIKSVDNNSNVTFRKHFVYPTKNDGTFSLRGSSAADIETYEVLELISLNKNSPFRDPAVTPLFERVDTLAEANARSGKRKALKDCYDAIQRWNYSEMQQVAVGFGMPTTLELGELKDRLETLAEANPTAFWNVIDSEEHRVKGIIFLAKEAGILAFNAVENHWFLPENGETVAELQRAEGADPTSQFAKILMTGAKGEALKQTIEKLITAKNRPTKK